VNCLTLFISSLELYTTAIVRSTGSDSSQVFLCQHTKAPCLR